MLSVLLLSLVTLGAGAAANFVDSLGKEITKEVSAAKEPIEQGIVAGVFSQCQNVKDLIGVSYDELEKSGKEPDVSKLTLVYRDEKVTVTFNITTAAGSLVQAPQYSKHQKLYIFVHGFTDDPSKTAFTTISDALLSLGNCNVLALDASSLIKWLYLRSTTYTRYIGEKLGEVLVSIVNDGVDPASVHVIGHSLGAHISGFTGKTFTNLTGLQLGRISGLDPAGPCYTNIDDDLRLKATDAAFVDVMHTDSGVFGLKEPIGQIDFYPNGGKEQPNCLSQSCSHSRTWYYFAESVTNPKGFPAVRCPSWGSFKRLNCTYDDVVYMGFPTPAGSTGKYYLQTSDEEPYALGTNGTHFNGDQAVIKSLGDSAKSVVGKLFG